MKRLILFFAVVFFALSSYGQNFRLDSVWHRKDVVIPLRSGIVQLAEQSVLWNIGTPVILTGGGTVFKNWYTGVTSGGAFNIYYAESLDGITWTQYTSNPVVTNHAHASMFYNGGTYHLYAGNGGGNSTQIDHYTSTDGVTFTLANAGVVSSNTAAWNASGVFNTWVDTLAGTWYMLVDGQSLAYGYADGLYTSSNGSTWTASGGNPVLPNNSGPYFTVIGGIFWEWGHSTMNNTILPTDGFRFKSNATLSSFTMTPGSSTFHRLAPGEGPNQAVGQIGDIDLVQWINAAGDTMVNCYYTETINGNSSGGAVLCVATFKGSLYQLVQTNENAYQTPQWEVNANNIFFNKGFIGYGTPIPSFPLDINAITWNGAGATMRVTNVLGQGSSTINIGSNAYYNGVAWANTNPAATGLVLDMAPNGFTIDTTAIGSSPNPIAVQGLKFGGSGGANGSYWYSMFPGVFGSVTYNGGGYSLQANTAFFTNVTLNQINKNFIGQGLISGVVQGDLFIGQTNAFATGTTGNWNTCLNCSGMNSVSTGTQNFAQGQNALNSATTASFNVAIGTGAFGSLLTTSFNTGIGHESFTNATGSNNTGVGAENGRSTTTGSSNTAIGYQTLYQNGTSLVSSNGSFQTALGANAEAQCSNCMIFGGTFPDGSYARVGFGGNPAPTSWAHLAQGLSSAGFSALKFSFTPNATTATSGTGTIVTITFAVQAVAPYPVGSQIIITGVTPSGYNGTFTVTACSTTTVTMSGTGTGAQTGAGLIVANGLLATPEPGAVELLEDSFYFTGRTGTRHNLSLGSGSGVTAVGTFSGSGQTNGASISGPNITFGPATASFPGMITTGTQTLAGNKTLNASFTVTHVIGNSTTPGIAAGTGAGTSPTVGILGTDQDGLITVTTGTSPAGTAATIVTVTFSASFPNNTFITLTPANSNAVALSGTTEVYPSGSTTTFTIISGTLALTGATLYTWYYHVGAN